MFDGKKIVGVEMDQHRWYWVFTLELEDGSKAIQVLAASSDGILVYDSLADYGRVWGL